MGAQSKNKNNRNWTKEELIIFLREFNADRLDRLPKILQETGSVKSKKDIELLIGTYKNFLTINKNPSVDILMAIMTDFGNFSNKKMIRKIRKSKKTDPGLDFSSNKSKLNLNLSNFFSILKNDITQNQLLSAIIDYSQDFSGQYDYKKVI